MNTTPQKIPAHETVYRQIRKMILFGDLAPGQPITIHGLAQTLDVGLTPIREALRRLTAEGALEFRGNRRICVPEMTLKDLEELAFARLSIEPKLANASANLLKSGQIDEISKINQAVNVAIETGDIHSYLQQNYNFHFSIYRAAQMPILLSISNSLWLRSGPSLRVVCGRIGTSNLPDNHKMAIDALRARDAEATAIAIDLDIKQGLDQIKKSLLGQ